MLTNIVKKKLITTKELNCSIRKKCKRTFVFLLLHQNTEIDNKNNSENTIDNINEREMKHC